MGTRAYFMVNVMDQVNQKELVKIINELDNTLEVDFVDPVVGDWDMVIMIEAPITVEAVAKKLAQEAWVKELKVLKIINILDRHQASKTDLSKAICEEGL